MPAIRSSPAPRSSPSPYNLALIPQGISALRSLSPSEIKALPKHDFKSHEELIDHILAIRSEPIPNDLVETIPYTKGKKVNPNQLAVLSRYFIIDHNPAKELRWVLGNDLRMSLKAVSIWFQNERANIKKGRNRLAPAASPSANGASVYIHSAILPPPTFSSVRRPHPPVRPITYRREYVQRDVEEVDELEYDVYPPRQYNHGYASSEVESEDEFMNDSDVTIETPTRKTHYPLPEVRVHAEENDPEVDEDTILAARILLGMTFAK